MSSAILYLAIIAIWACVLIPRWLKRGAVAPVAAPAGADSAVTNIDQGYAGGADETQASAAEPLSSSAILPSADPEPAGQPSASESRRHMLTARRRLLVMLAGLEIAATGLAATGLAAVWVIIPPTLMLAGYLLLLREAAKADAERAEHEAEAAARASERAAARARAARRDTPADGTSTAGVAAAAQELAARFAAAPVPADYEDAGRDFAPGLAGKYTTSNAEAVPAADDYEQGYYEDYEAPRLRAVGD
jgi:hypothetical protein